MPFRYDLRRPVIRFTVSGSVHFNTTLAQLKEGLQMARQVGPEGHLWEVVFDLSEAKDRRTPEEMRGAAMALSQYAHVITGRVALVVADSLNVEKGKMFSEFAAQLGHQPRAFETLKDAEAWLRSEREAG